MSRLKVINFIVLLSTFYIPPKVEAQTRIKICHEANYYPPYIYESDSLPSGILVDILHYAADNSEWNIELYSSSWKRCQQDVLAGRAHALFAMVNTKKRNNQYAFPPLSKLTSWHMWQASYPFFTPKGTTFEPQTYIPEKGIGAPLRYVVWDMLVQKKWLSPYQYEPSEGLKMLALNRLDGYVVEKFIGLNLLKKHNLIDEVTISHYSLLDTKWYLPFNKDFYHTNKKVIHKFWQHIAYKRNQIEQQMRSKPAR